ncbi:hypothetical protein M9458_050563, partial [Cirrhinus mrigala]
RREDATSANRTTRLLHFKVDLPPCFHGDGRDKDSFSLWKARLELAVKACADAQTQDLTAILPTRLSGDALAYWLSLFPDIQQNYELCVAALNYVFGRKQFLLHFQTFVNARPRMPTEPLEVFAAEITRLVLEPFPNYGECAIAMERFRRFVAGLDPVLQAECHVHGATSLEDALAIACKWERAQEVLRLAPLPPLSQKNSLSPNLTTTLPSESLSAMVSTKTTASGDISSEIMTAVKQLTADVKALRMEVSQLKRQHTSSGQRDYSPERGRDKHHYSPLSSPRRYLLSPASSPHRRDESNSFIHREGDRRRGYGDRHISPSSHYQNCHMSSSPHHRDHHISPPLTHQDRHVSLPPSYRDRHVSPPPPHQDRHPSQSPHYAAQHASLTALRRDQRVSSTSPHHDRYGHSTSDHQDQASHHQDRHTSEWLSNKFSGGRSSTDHLPSSGDHRVSFVDEDVDLQGNSWSQMNIFAKIQANIGEKEFTCNYVGLLDPEIHSVPGLFVARTVTSVKAGVTCVRAMNPTNEDCHVPCGTRLGEFNSLVTQPGEEFKIQEPTVAQIQTEMDPCPKSKVDLSQSALNSADDYDYGRTNLVKHTIRTGDAQPIRQRAYRTSPHIRAEIDRQVQQLLSHDVIEESCSPWASPVVLVKKRDGSYRFCIDFKKLNAVTVKDSYPLPRASDALDSLAGARWFSTMDLSSGYCQVELDPNDREKTAFNTGSALYQFKVMPMGLTNAPPTFQRLMELVLRGLH